jgi:hypothetical protein
MRPFQRIILNISMLVILGGCGQSNDGGIIGGGDLEYATLLDCRALSLDPRFVVVSLRFVAEADEAGHPVPSARVSMQLEGPDGLFVAYYPTGSLAGKVNFRRLRIMESLDVANEGVVLGEFRRVTKKTGKFLSVDKEKLPDLAITNCREFAARL